jgi:hypothetical protein
MPDIKEFRKPGQDAYAYDTTVGGERIGRNVRLIANEAGPVIQAREGRKDSGLERKVVKAATGSAYGFNPLDVKPRPGHVWGMIVPTPHPSAHSELALSDPKPMLRHRMVTPKGEIFIFRQGSGDLIRIGGEGNEQEWTFIPDRDIIGQVSGSDITIREGWMLCFVVDLPQESSSLLQIVDDTHLYNRKWAAGMAACDAQGRYEGLFGDGDTLIYEARSVTEVAFMESVYHAVKIDNVYGVRT